MSKHPLNLLFVEPRFPGRLGPIADWLVRKRGHRVHFACHQIEPDDHQLPSVGRGLDFIRFNVGGIAREPSVPWWRGFERGLCYAYGAHEVIDAFRPRPVDLILGRSGGLGSTLFMPISYPKIPILQYFDHFLHPRAGDLADDDASSLPSDYVHWRRSANAMDLVELENGVVPWTGSHWQRDLYPAEYRDRFAVIPPSIDTRRFTRPETPEQTLCGRAIPTGTKVVTFIASALDRLHGFDHFVALAERLLAARADVLCIATGDATVQTMLDVRHHGTDYASTLLAGHPLAGHDRFWRVGRVSPSEVAQLLGRSDLHIHPERVHPVSSTLLEAMSARCVILAADTPPLREIVEHERTALLSPFDDIDAPVRRALQVLDAPQSHAHLAQSASATARERFDHDAVLPRFDQILSDLVPQPQAP